MEKDAVFIPAGWDNDKKIAILYENMHRWVLNTVHIAPVSVLILTPAQCEA